MGGGLTRFVVGPKDAKSHKTENVDQNTQSYRATRAPILITSVTSRAGDVQRQQLPSSAMAAPVERKRWRK